MAQGMLHRLIGLLMDASEGLGANCDCSDVERLAVMIHRIMSYQSRQFHTLQHVFGFLEGGADHETAVSAAFHDLVYFQVDDGMPPELEGLLGPFVKVEPGRIRLGPRGASGLGALDSAYEDCLAVFGFEAGAELAPFGGLNEFLSALAMFGSLAGHLPREPLVAIAACIEATIPFRAAKIGEALEERLGRMARQSGLGLGREEIAAAVHRAVRFANADVSDFANPDTGLFLSNTWKLLPESNPTLRRAGAFSVAEYRASLIKMLGFFRSLKPGCVFHSYRGLPDDAAMARYEEAVSRNLQLAQAYMQAKLLAVGLVEALAALSGGDAPMALFMGDLPRPGEETEGLCSFLPPRPTPPWISAEHPVYRLLRDGRLEDSSFDLKNSPLALYLYNRLSPNAWGERSRAADSFFAGRLPAKDFFLGFDPEFRSDMARACSRMVPTRRDAFSAWLLPAAR